MSVALVVEDEPEFSTFVVAVFERAGFDAFAIEYIVDAIEIIQQSNDVEILFINLAEQGDDFELVKVVSRQWPTIKLILLSTQMDSLRALPPAVFVTKPTTPAVLIAMIEHVALASANNRTSRGTLH
ncbi:MAG: hypothetical protein P4M13_04370 [Alphaproteobacteria bacterium]|nr:hypothetical protein [Alphaproteobacteria bacterium]